MNSFLRYLTLILLAGFAFGSGSSAQTKSSAIKARSDTAAYAKTPGEYAPYGRFSQPYKRFFIDQLEYPGHGRHIPEPEHIDTVKIGFIGPIYRTMYVSTGEIVEVEMKYNQRELPWDGSRTSHLATIGIKMMQGAQLAVEQANSRGGYRGKLPFALIVRNDNGNWRASERDMVMLAWKDSVWAVLGTVDGENTHVAIRVALKAEIPIMNTADTDPTLVETNIPWVFRCITDDRQMCYLLADFSFKKLQLRRIAALRAMNRYGRMSIDEFRDAATRLGYPFTVELQYKEGESDFSQQLEIIRSLNVDGIITYGNSRESALILKQMREMGMQQWYFGSDRMVTEEFIEIAGENHGKVAAGYPFYPDKNDPDYVRFTEDFRTRFDEEAEQYAAHAYDGVNMLIEAIGKAGLNRALIRDELVAMPNYKGVTGRKEFDAVFSDRSPATLAVLKNGKFEFYTHEQIFSDKLEFIR